MHPNSKNRLHPTAPRNPRVPRQPAFRLPASGRIDWVHLVADVDSCGRRTGLRRDPNLKLTGPIADRGDIGIHRLTKPVRARFETRQSIRGSMGKKEIFRQEHRFCLLGTRRNREDTNQLTTELTCSQHCAYLQPTLSLPAANTAKPSQQHLIHKPSYQARDRGSSPLDASHCQNFR